MKSKYSPIVVNGNQLSNSLGITIKSMKLPKITFQNPLSNLVLSSLVSPLMKGATDIVRQAFSQQNSKFRESALMFSKFIESLPPRIQEYFYLFSQHCWYLDKEMDMPFASEISECFSNDAVEKADSILIKYFEDRLPEIEKSITERYPDRAHIIKDAIESHLNKKYNLSIPVLLAQADGICISVTGKSYFRKKDDKRDTAGCYDNEKEFTKAWSTPLNITTPINESKKEREQNPSCYKGDSILNRHTILHGESLNYGTKKNSLKALSLINFMSQLKPLHTEH